MCFFVCCLSFAVCRFVGLFVHGLHVLSRDVGELGLGGVVLAVRREALGDAHAGAVELAHDPLLLLSRRALGRGENEVGGPPERDGLLCEAQRRHDQRQVVREELLREVCELDLIRAVVGVDGARAADGGDASLLGFLWMMPTRTPPMQL